MIFLGVTSVRHITITYNLGDLADWVSAIGTIAAVIVSLYLANRRDKPRILISFMEQSQETCRITNKSHQPVELVLKIDSRRLKYSLPPIGDNLGGIDTLKNDQPFNIDYMMFAFSPEGKKRLVAKGIDLISNTKYRFLFFKKDEKWLIKQYKLLHIGNFTI